jgi:hypothetical protein
METSVFVLLFLCFFGLVAAALVLFSRSKKTPAPPVDESSRQKERTLKIMSDPYLQAPPRDHL